jgi:plasmid rolling circle replication initiator protein Rep
MFGQVSQEMNLLEKQGYRYIFFTPTIKNCSGAELSGTLNTLQKGNAELLRNPDFKRAVVGAIKISEITTLRYDDYHPHFHYILAVRPSYFGQDYLSQAKWVQIWRSCCKLDYDPRCDVRAFKGDKKAIAEASKYTLKSTDIFKGTEIQIDDTVRTLMTSLFNRRLVSWTGVFAQARKQLMLDDVENGDLINTNIEAIRADVAEQIIHYGWRSGFYNRL